MVFVSNASKMHIFLECHYLKSLFIIALAFKHLYLYIQMVMDENYTLRVYYSKFHVLHIHQVYSSTLTEKTTEKLVLNIKY